jgi:hypothetical protein
VNQSPESVFDQHEGSQQSKIGSDDNAEITGNNSACMISEKGTPSLITAGSGMI